MNNYYISKIIEYAKQDKVKINIVSTSCVDSFVYRMYVEDLCNKAEVKFNISTEDKNMIDLISKVENIKNITIL